ncbi:MAG: SusC/RagA family TonB-linked outer membrane protein [Ginsengibacter sp.]
MRKLLIFLSAIVCFVSGISQTQTRTVSGTIVDNNGLPLPGVSIVPVGSAGGTTTNLNGVFSLEVPSSVSKIEVSFVGFTTQTVDIPEGGRISISLAPSNSNLDEIIITGYSRLRRSQYSGAATKVTSEKINFIPNASFDQILQGKAPGLTVLAGSGQPGASARVEIRGATSITGGNSPLFVIDGMPVEAGVFQSINPNDFESVDVLRDAIATAQYGNRGSSGVIVATTKRGRSGKTIFTYSGQAGITQPGQERFDMMSSTELLQFQENLGLLLPNALPGYVYSRKNPVNVGLPAAVLAQYDAKLDSLRNINTDWKKVFQRTGSFQSHDINLSGGTAGTRYFISGGYYKEDGIGIRSNLERYTVRANIDSKTDKLTVSFNGTAGYTQRNLIESENGIALANPFASTYFGLPYQKLYNAFGTVDTGGANIAGNAYSRIFSTTNSRNQLKLLSSVNLNYDVTSNIYIGGFAGVDYRQTTNENSVFPNTYAANHSGFPTGPPTNSDLGGGSFGTGYNNATEYIVRALAGYHNIFADKHDVDLQLISEYTRDYAKSFNFTGYGIDPKLLNTPVAITPGTADNLLIPDVAGSKTGRSLYAAMALLKYSYDGRYTVNASFRRDGSSQLPVKNRFENFYAAGVTWNIMKEKFSRDWYKINDLRLRLSYGVSANADGFPIGNFGYLSTYGSGIYAGGQTIVPDNAGNPDLKWEKIKTLNLGLDFGVLNNRITGSVEVYEKKGTDVIVTQKLPFETGFASQNINAGIVRDRGIEVLLNGEIVHNKNIVWSVGGNVAYNKNRVISLGQVKEFEQGTEIERVGLPIGSHYIVKWAGVDAATGQPLYFQKDGKLTNVFSDNDRVAEFGTYHAPWVGGFNTSLRVRGITLDALFSFQQGFSRFNNQDFFQLNSAFATFAAGLNQRKEMLTMWQKAGDVTDIQSPLFERQFVSKDIQDASFLRFRTLTLAYNFGNNLLDKTKFFSAARFFVQGQNLFTWTKWSGFDPEDNDNVAQYEYPTPRTFTVGLSFSLK